MSIQPSKWNRILKVNSFRELASAREQRWDKTTSSMTTNANGPKYSTKKKTIS
jgi:hypothetical protein